VDFSVRNAEICDIPALCRLRLAYFDEEFGALPPEQLQAISAQLPPYFAAHLGKDCITAAAVLPDGSLAANAILMISEKPANPFFPNGRSGYVLGVYTMPEYRGQGIATRLMQHIQQEAKRLRLDIVTLSASEMGKSIYEKIGFSVRHSKFTEMEWLPE
jgi:GNAT superfamily N-acetyltransferase